MTSSLWLLCVILANIWGSQRHWENLRMFLTSNHVWCLSQLLNWCLKYIAWSSTFRINFLICSSTEPTPETKNLVWLFIKLGFVWPSTKYSLLASCCRDVPSKWHAEGWVSRALLSCRISCKCLFVPAVTVQSIWKHNLPSHIKRKVHVGGSGKFSQQSCSSNKVQIHHVSPKPHCFGVFWWRWFG